VVQAAAVAAVGAIAVTGLCLAANRVHDNSERAMLRQRATEAGAALGAVLPVFQVPLNSSMAVARETGASAAAFERVIGGFVSPSGITHSGALWSVPASGTPRAVTRMGEPATLDVLPAADRARILRSAPTSGIGIVDLTDRSPRAVGFILASARDGDHVVAYLEAPVPDDPTALDLTGDAFDDLDYAVYLGDRVDPAKLLLATTNDLPLHGAEQISVPWGDTQMQIAFTPRGQLSGTLLARLPWIIGLVGGLTTLAFTWLTLKLGRAVGRAGALARDNERLYLEQRTVAHSLQRDLLPTDLPTHPAVELAYRYQAGVAGIEVGGDWYDAHLSEDGRLLLTVGDVSGQGLPAATVMVSLRLAIRAYANQGDGPATILAKLNGLLDVRTDDHFATVLCASYEPATGRLVLASAGHPPPVVVGPDGATALQPIPPGYPIGVQPDAHYEEATCTLAPGSLLVAFTDGLFERRGETVDQGLARVVASVRTARDLPMADLVERLTTDLEASGAPDDTAVLAMRTSAAGDVAATPVGAAATGLVSPTTAAGR
jgi:hypothetical protein